MRRWVMATAVLVLLGVPLGTGEGPLSLSAGELHAQQPDPQEKIERVRAHYGADADEILAIVERAREAGVPADLVLSKALEGAAKRVPADRVAPVLSEYTDRASRAVELLGPEADRGSVVAATDALRRGVPGESVSRVARDAAGHTPVALVVLAELVELDVPVEHALNVVEQAMAGEAPGEAMLRAPSEVRRLIREGTPPGQAAAAVARGLGQRGPPAFVPGRGPPGADGPPGLTGQRPPVPPGAGPPEGRGPPDDGPPGGPPDG